MLRLGRVMAFLPPHLWYYSASRDGCRCGEDLCCASNGLVRPPADKNLRLLIPARHRSPDLVTSAGSLLALGGSTQVSPNASSARRATQSRAMSKIPCPH